MKDPSKSVFAAALVLALTATPYALAGSSAGGAATTSAGALSLSNPNQSGAASPGVTDPGTGAGTGVGAGRGTGATGRPNGDKTNGLNKGTNSGANSDVNRFRGLRPYGQ
jgi:hypothetical protein